MVDPNGLDWGVATWQEGDQTITEHRYFDGRIGKKGAKYGGHTYSAVKFGNNGRGSLDVSDNAGNVIRISNYGHVYQVVYTGPKGDGPSTGQGNLNASAGLFDGAVPFGRELREWALEGNGGVDTDSPEYKNSALISAGVIIGASMLDGGGEAKLSEEAVGLAKQLASESQTAELLTGGGKAIIGSGTNKALFEGGRLAGEYGGEAADWAKVTSPAFKAPDKAIIETHAYRNMSTGKTVELKSVSSSFPGRP